MPRIRTIKPEFFRDEDLQDIEAQHGGCYPMLVYAGLWGHCDKNGTFPWQPRQLKLDILPFLPFNMEQSLQVLEGAGFVKKWEALGKQWGSIPRFLDHQRISGSEATDPSKFPVYQAPTEKEALGKQRGSTRDELVSQEGKGREGKGSTAFALPDWVPQAEWDGWIEVRRKNRWPLTGRALNLALAELVDLRGQGHDPAKTLDLATLKGWRSLYAPPASKPIAADPFKGVQGYSA